MESTVTTEPASVLGSFFRHLVIMPLWHRHVLLLAMLVAGAGAVGHVRQMLFSSTPAAHDAAVSTPSSGLVQPTDTPAPAANSQPWYLTPRMLSIGGSIVGGFIIGWIARAFVKTVVMLSLLAGAALFGLSYFHILNVDFTRVTHEYGTAMAYLLDQVSRLKDVAIAYLPVHTGGAVGAFMGFRRR